MPTMPRPAPETHHQQTTQGENAAKNARLKRPSANARAEIRPFGRQVAAAAAHSQGIGLANRPRKPTRWPGSVLWSASFEPTDKLRAIGKPCRF